MESSLFKKYQTNIDKQKNNKKEVLDFIKEKTGIELEEKTITLSKKQITIQTTSVIKQKLFQKNIQTILKEKGFILKH